ncbi:hypothetical protein [Geodermatophilus chilensis]|uniref:hypothetical protein n=1 Tax=Geodermatophilus chilensis TaxID=2035835 RepID=UPI000C268582|nr:hypothetical protein [Geodermatophilus chilensis]
MNRWVQRGLRTALLTGGLLAAGAGVAAADENDLSADVLGATATVPVREDATVGTPVVTGTGEDLAIGGDGGASLPIDTNTDPGTTLLGQDGTGGVSVPIRVTEATDAPPDPRDGLTVTVPVNTSGGGTAGTTVTAPVVTGDLGQVLDGDPLSGLEVDVDLAEPIVPGPGGSGVLLDLEDTVTIGNADGTTSPDTVLTLPAGLDGDRPTTVALPLPGGEGRGPLSGDDVDVQVGGLVGDGRPEQDPAGDREPALSVPIDTGGLLGGLLGGDTLSGTTVDVDLGGLLGGGPGSGSVVTVPVDEGRTGTLGDLLVRVTLPVDLFGRPGGDGDGEAPGNDGPTPLPGTAPGAGLRGPGTGSGGGYGGSGSGSGSEYGGTPGSSGGDVDCGAPTAGHRAPQDGGGRDGTGSAPGGAAGEGPAAGAACGTGSTAVAGVRPSSSTGAGGPVAAAAGLLAVAAGLLAAVGRRLRTGRR